MRGATLLAFLVAMPLCALPLVGKWYDAWLLGDAKPAAVQEPVKLSGEPGAGPESKIPKISNAGSRFTPISRRLQELGADYLRLETLDAQGGQYRFQCRVSLAGNSAYSRPFEASAADPVEAMERVLKEVESWRGAHQRVSQIPSAVQRR